MSSLRFHIVIFGLTVVASILLAGTDGACNNAEITQCQNAQGNQEQSKFTYTRAELETLCRSVDEFVNCIKATSCANETQGRELVNRVKSVTYYMCKQRKEEFLENAQCFGSEKLEKSEEYCLKKFYSEPNKATCEAESRTISCLVKSVDSCCGKKASALIVDYVRASLQQKTSLVTSGNCQRRSDLDVQILPLCSGRNGCVKLVQCTGTTLLAFIILALLRNDWI